MTPTRIAIIGNSGSGKSTLAQRLAAAQDLTPLDLDTVYWASGQIAVAREPAAALAELRRFFDAHPLGWVIEGCYASLIAAALPERPLLVFLDPGVDACLANCRARPWEPHKYASKDEQDARLAFLLEWVSQYDRRDGELSRGGHRELFEQYDGPKQLLESRAAAEAFAASFNAEVSP